MTNEPKFNFFAKLGIVEEKFILYLTIPKKWAYIFMLVLIMRFLPDWWEFIQSAIQLISKH